MKTFKVWIQIEEHDDEDEGGGEYSTVWDESVGEYDTMEEAQAMASDLEQRAADFENDKEP